MQCIALSSKGDQNLFIFLMFLKEVLHAHQCCIYLIKKSLKKKV